MTAMERRHRGLRELCELLGYTRQAYYQYRSGFGKRLLKEDLLIQQVIAHRESQPRVGGRKLLVMLQPFMDAHRMEIGRDLFFELLKVNRLLIGRKRRNKPRTTFSDHWMKKYPDLVKGLVLSCSDELWVSDITYIHLPDKCFSYLSLVTDAYSRKIVGYCLNDDLTTDGPVRALEMAIRGRQGEKQLLHHSDRGSQYCSGGYVSMLNDNKIGISMTQSGDPRDNAIAERVNGILKLELLEEVYPNFTEASKAVTVAIDIYNQLRPHSSIDMFTPEQAHVKTGEISRRWKSYYQTAEKELAVT